MNYDTMLIRMGVNSSGGSDSSDSRRKGSQNPSSGRPKPEKISSHNRGRKGPEVLDAERLQQKG